MKILGYDYFIETNKDTEEISAAGKCIATKQEIMIASELAPQQKVSTLLHEIIEAINYHLELGLEHRNICGLEVGLYQALIDNGVDLSPLLKEEN